ncbi:Mn2+/Fe2+ transporter [Ureibacillus massiliensis 4400831 = CIP 108448 = CCUG 49529]|uniref:Mn2+/Fe2+ transporter n=1 Tax=Ureibacillus massiliensis 4400831 = CIP 108448 = CCUG 49529 TaxID=1211035 RepID=A0A0A3IUG0_9BACL|nr:Nramp family divalent metal transporter [Ureibacillus massiliensis]KGR88306.1 Mn2+/Fe2+ transporter [Ureibacillus massiliensis 4400831 = CIP 108448 = CCUG 49529]
MELQKETIQSNESFIQKIWGNLKVYGPGIIMILTMMGAGDLITASVSGANYGYNLMWLLVLSLLIRFVICNIMGRFQIYNNEGMTILEGYARLHKFFPFFFGIASLFIGHLIVAQMIKGSGIALNWMFGFGSDFIWSVIVVLVSLLIMGRNVYKKLEWVMKGLLAILTVSFIGLAVYSKPDVVGILKGTVGFGLPDDTGAYSVILVGVSLVGAVAGSLTNLIYPYFLQDKGWIKPMHKRIQRNDLLFGFIAAIVLTLAIWIIGAEILRPNNIQVETIDDISLALAIYMGELGSWIFYLGVFAILYSSVIGTAIGYAKVITDCYYKVTNKVLTKEQKIEGDSKFKWISLFLLISPVIWSVPGSTGFVALTLFTNALNIVALPAIAVGLLIISNQKKYLGKHTNNWFENIMLVGTTILAIWGSYQLLISFFS